MSTFFLKSLWVVVFYHKNRKGTNANEISSLWKISERIH